MKKKTIGKLLMGIGIAGILLAVAIAILEFALNGSVFVGLRGISPMSMLIFIGNQLTRDNSLSANARYGKFGLLIVVITVVVLIALAILAAWFLVTATSHHTAIDIRIGSILGMC